MPRNLEKRVELLFPVQDEKLHIELIGIINDYFHDNCKASFLDSNGTWIHLTPGMGEKPFRVQKEMLSRAARTGENTGSVKLDYNVRRSPPATSNV
jgi:polyphosphate kinase